MPPSSRDRLNTIKNSRKRRRELAGLRNTAANAGPPSSSKTFGTKPSLKDTKKYKGNLGSYGQVNPGNLMGIGLDYFGNQILKPAIEKAQGDIAEIPNVGKSPEGTVFGGLAIGSIVLNPREAGKKGLIKTTRTIGPKLASEIAGVGTRRKELVNWVLKRGAGIKEPSEARKVVVNTVDNTTALAEDLGPKLIGTIKNKSDTIRDDIYNHTIGDKSIAQYMEESGLELFSTFDERAAQEADTVIGVVRPVLNNTQEAVNESLDLMKQFSPSGATIRNITDPLSDKVKHVWENDHAASGSVAKGIVTASAEEAIRREGKLTQEWRDSTEELLRFVDDPNNLRTVSRWYNQFKSNMAPETMMTELNNKFPELAKHVKNLDYLDYLMSQWDQLDSLAQSIPYAGRVISQAGGLGDFAKQVPRSWPPSKF